MTYMWLFLFAVAVWGLVAYSSSLRTTLEERRGGEELVRTPVALYVLLPPTLLTGLAYLVDRSRSPVGTYAVVAALVLVGMLSAALALRARALLHQVP